MSAYVLGTSAPGNSESSAGDSSDSEEMIFEDEILDNPLFYYPHSPESNDSRRHPNSPTVADDDHSPLDISNDPFFTGGSDTTMEVGAEMETEADHKHDEGDRPKEMHEVATPGKIKQKGRPNKNSLGG